MEGDKDVEHATEAQSRKGNARIQRGSSQKRFRPQGKKSQAGNRDCNVGIRPVKEAQKSQLSCKGGYASKASENYSCERGARPPTAARIARLHHTTDDRAGITRHKARSGFDYRRPDGSLVRDLETLQRIKSLVIPPAWSAVVDQP
jgi:hypothetical protein